DKLSKYLSTYYQDEKSDLFSVFIKKGFDLTKKHGLNSMVTMQSWMFLSSFEKFRKYILENKSIITLNHMDNMVMGIAFGTSATTFRNTNMNFKGTYTYITTQDLNQS